MAQQMRVYFEADPNDETGEAVKGRELIVSMGDLIRMRRSKL
jgi:hypothetical protein